MIQELSKREQVREERRQQILEAALKVFSEKGYHTANVSDGTIYWYFDSKDELFQAAILSAFDDIGDATLALLAECYTATEKLRSLAQSMEGLADVAESLFMLFLGYYSSSDRRDESTKIWTDLLKQFNDIVVAVIEEGIAAGEFREVDAESLAWALLAAYDGLAAYVMLMPELDLSRIGRTFIETLLKGLLVDPPGVPA